MKICLIGNNLTSLILANILSKKNFFVEIYSSNRKNFKYKTRTLGITQFNLNYLIRYYKNLNVKAQNINEIKVQVQNKKKNDELIFNQNKSTLFYMIEYEKLFLDLKKKIKKNKKIFIKYYKDKKKLTSLLNTDKYQLVINCDRSNILNKKFLKDAICKDYKNKAFTTIIDHTKIKNNKAFQTFTKYGPIAFLPLSSSRTSVVFSLELKTLKNINDKSLIKIINQFNPCYKILSFKDFESFNLKMQMPKKYFYKNILFFGDALHTVHPLAGQGFNMSIRDIIHLIEIIDYKMNLGLNIDESIYSEFEKKAKSFNVLFSYGLDFIYEFVRFNRKMPENISKNIFSLINNSNKIKEFGIKLANRGNL